MIPQNLLLWEQHLWPAWASAGDTHYGEGQRSTGWFCSGFLMAVGGKERGAGPFPSCTTALRVWAQEGCRERDPSSHLISRAHGPCGILTYLQQFVLKTLLCQGGTGARLRLCPTVNTRLEGLPHRQWIPGGEQHCEDSGPAYGEAWPLLQYRQGRKPRFFHL